MAFVSIGGYVLHWQEDGVPDGTALVFANSLGTDFRIWDAMLPAFADRYRLIRYDKSGHGLSDLSPATHTLEGHVDDLLALLDHAGVSKAAVIGLSVGGLIAQGLALRVPERISALVLCDTACKIGSEAAWADRIAAVEKSGIAGIADMVLQRWFAASFRAERKTELAGWRNMLVRSPVEGYLATCAAIRDADYTLGVPTLRVRTLCVVGEEDGSTPPSVVRATADLIPGSHFEIITGAGHMPPIEQPAVLAALIARHIEEAGHA